MATTKTFHGFEPYQALAHHLGFARIDCREYLRGEGVQSPDDGRSGTAYPDEFIVTLTNGETRRFVTPVEWELRPPASLTVLDIFAHRGQGYRIKDQSEYVMRMLRECKEELDTGSSGGTK